MPTARRSRRLPADPDRVWRVVGDPHHLPRWWPRVQRVENVDADAFTEVLATDKGRQVRADFRVLESDAPRLRRWEQMLEGTPFERVLAGSETAIELSGEGDSTRVTLTIRQRLRGLSRFGGFLVRRATRRIIDDALDRLEQVV
jgi:carbon monoxide dehydrogenase subunit G